MAAVVSFFGVSGTGKTTLIEAAVRELKKRGYRVAVIKHAHHGFEIDQPGKDTWRFAQAGSDIVLVSSPERMAIIERVSEERWLPQHLALIGDKVDIVLVEGYKWASKVKIEVSVPGKDTDVAKTVDFLVEQIRQQSQQYNKNES
jgi:molybdopterin-guanine dinucleotide biosynthesis protein B